MRPGQTGTEEVLPSSAGIRALAELCRESGVEELEAADGTWTIHLRLDLTATPAGTPAQVVPVSLEPDGPYTFHSQWVGVFHRAPDADAEPFAQEGQNLSDGDLIGIVVAMQLQHEVRIDRAGILRRFLVPDHTPIEYGQPLLELD